VTRQCWTACRPFEQFSVEKANYRGRGTSCSQIVPISFLRTLQTNRECFAILQLWNRTTCPRPTKSATANYLPWRGIFMANEQNIDSNLYINTWRKTFLSKLRAWRSVRFGIVKVYVEKACRKIKFMYNIQGVPNKTDKSIALLFIGGF
jgi:hypothetical protein